MTTSPRDWRRLKSMKTEFCCVAMAIVSWALVSAAQSPPALDASALKWDAESKTNIVKAGDLKAPFRFTVTNVSSREVSINHLPSSCGCTIATLPTMPYKLGPGSNVSINVSMDLAGKWGMITKSIRVESSIGTNFLFVSANIPTDTKQAEAK
jgi:hypothetical protein